MKRALTFCLFLGILQLTAQDYYGERFEPKVPKENLAGTTEGDMQLAGKIESTCAMKGCWMKVDLPDGNQIRVTFKDYGFFVPTSGMEGKDVVVNGILEKQEVSVEHLRHYAKDAGKSEEEIARITEPKVEYTFVADGVLIK